MLSSFRVWKLGFQQVLRALMRQAALIDGSLSWLRATYTRLYYEDGCCCEPLASDAIKVRTPSKPCLYGGGVRLIDGSLYW